MAWCRFLGRGGDGWGGTAWGLEADEWMIL